MTTRMKFLIALGLVLFGVAGRMFPHFWDTTPIVAIGIIAGIYLGGRYAIAVPLVAMFTSDVLIGPYSWPVMLTVYGTLAAIGMLGYVLRRHKSTETLAATSIVSSTLFFLATNWAVWQFGTMYAKSWSGLMFSYEMGLPFYRNALIGDLAFTLSLYALFELARFGYRYVRRSSARVTQKQIV